MPDNPRILIIDPDASRRSELKDALSGLPFTVVAEAHYGIQALRLAFELQPDLILVRVEPPFAPGLHMLEAIQDHTPRCTPVALTSEADAATARRLMLAGARAQIVTPPSRDVLRRSLLIARRRHLATLQRIEHPDEFEVAPAGCVVTVLGAKGGVGKTSLAVNLAIALATRTAAGVVLVDCDPVYGDVALHMGITPEWAPRHGGSNGVRGLEIETQLMEHRSGISVLAARADATGALPEPDGVRRELVELARRFDFVVVDTPDGLSEYTTAALDASSIVILLTSSEVSSVKDARLLRDTLRRRDFDTDRLKLVVNHATQANSVTDDEISRAVGEPVFWSLPHDREAPQATQTGEPVVITHPKSPLAQGVDAMALLLGGIEVEESPSWLRRVIFDRRGERY